MTKTLIRHGNSLAVVIDKPLLDMLRVTADTPLELTTNGDALMIRPVRSTARQKRLTAALARINQCYAKDLQRLAE